ncbi:branched-chain amino acid transport system II carrier protein [Numidum massiliense]|uniref:branched-chain amino acid transport system II carrier protein n=1 Tax=Numidum massiliense TaxID=1522315 RepID=UPI0006D591EA|nr:branched-chain amino acid transport system II carrier protein [Numidum massiliense]
MQPLRTRDIVTIGFMLFALFFGAGNLIFPPALAQTAGTQTWTAMLGFLITGIGLPMMGVIAVVLNGSMEDIAGRAHRVFGLVFSIVTYLAIGPLFAIPRTASVGYEIGVIPFLPDSLQAESWPLLLYTIGYFTLTLWLSLNPTKLVDRIGKILTPTLLFVVFALFVKGWLQPIGLPGTASGDYLEASFFKGFTEGYLTLDALAGLAFGIVAINAFKAKGVTDSNGARRAVIRAGVVAGLALAAVYLALAYRVTDSNGARRAVIRAGVVAGLALAAVYLALAYLGATSQSLGAMDNGGQLLAAICYELFGTAGLLLLGVAVTVACLTTSVGLVTAVSMYFTRFSSRLTYKRLAILCTLVGFAIANLGLTNIIAISYPVLVAIYPLAIVIIILGLAPRAIRSCPHVYRGALLFTGAISFVDGFNAIERPTAATESAASVVEKWFNIGLDKLQTGADTLTGVYIHLPLYTQGMGWLLPALVGGALGFLWGWVKRTNRAPAKKRTAEPLS